jgi:hypothetical protein
VDTGVFDANKGSEAGLRAIFSTVGKSDMAGQESLAPVAIIAALRLGWMAF